MTRKLPAIFDRTPFEPLLKQSVGFDELFDRIFEDVLPTVNSQIQFPPYNIRRASNTDIVIEVALAGYREEDIEITVEANNILAIRGGKSDEDVLDYIHQGVAARKFERKFALAENAEVVAASLSNGMLLVSVRVNEPQKEEPKRIQINAE